MKIQLIAGILLIIQLTTLSCAKENNDESDVERIYTKSIERFSSNEFEAGLIEKAEKYYPPREKVVAVADTRLTVPVSGYWFYNEFDGVYIPFAITNDAINYYSSLIDNFNSNKKDVFFIMADFNYNAKITFEENYSSPSFNSHIEMVVSEDFSSVYVVELTLKWEQYCGSLCAMWIDKKRIVVFNQFGELIKVFLDGEISVPVS